MDEQWLQASTVAKKCEISHWLSCGAGGLTNGLTSRDSQNFSDG